MFKKLQRRIIIITMAITSAVLVFSGILIMLFSSTMRPEPRPHPDVGFNAPSQEPYDNQELQEYIKNDREEGQMRLLITLLCVGAIVELIVFVIIYVASHKIIRPVKETYEKQKIFIANASHELKTPLAVIQANMEALEVDDDNEKWKSNIENEISHANKLVLDLLQLARLDSGSINASKPEEVDLNQEISQRLKMFAPKFSGKLSLEGEGCSAIMLPKQDFLQVLDILLDNATKYGKNKIVVSLRDSRISVTNNGATIAKDDLEKVFDRFYQTDKTKAGSGLGLSIAKALCEQNGWNIYCESSGGLTSFVLDLTNQRRK